MANFFFQVKRIYMPGEENLSEIKKQLRFVCFLNFGLANTIFFEFPAYKNCILAKLGLAKTSMF